MTKVSIIGTGQQGTSMAMSFSEAGYNICAYDNDPETRDGVRSITQNHVNITMHDSLVDTVHDADIIVLATPIDKFSVVLDAINSHVKQGVIITDIGSGKVRAIKEMEESKPEGSILIPAHILTGRAGSGAKSAEEGMYRGAACVIIPQNKKFNDQQKTVEKLWEDAGSRIIHMEADTHDRLYGAISHFQRMIAISLTACGEDPLNTGKALNDYKCAGNSMLDMTRIAKSSIDMWLPIFADNREAILEASHGFQTQMQVLKEKITYGDIDGLRDMINQAHDYRKEIPENRARESIGGEVSNWASEFNIDKLKANGNIISSSFDSKAGLSLVKRLLIPTIIATASILNLRELEQLYFQDIDLPNVITPAFKDGTAPVLSNPDYITDLLCCNHGDLVNSIDDFESKLNAFITAIDLGYEPFISSSIEDVSSVRDDIAKEPS